MWVMVKCYFVMQCTLLCDLHGGMVSWQPSEGRELETPFFLEMVVPGSSFLHHLAAMNCCLNFLPLMETIIFLENVSPFIFLNNKEKYFEWVLPKYQKITLKWQTPSTNKQRMKGSFNFRKYRALGSIISIRV